MFYTLIIINNFIKFNKPRSDTYYSSLNITGEELSMDVIVPRTSTYCFRGKTVKNLTLSLLKSVRPYDDTNPDWTDLVSEFKEMDQYLVQCHGCVSYIYI